MDSVIFLTALSPDYCIEASLLNENLKSCVWDTQLFIQFHFFEINQIEPHLLCFVLAVANV